MDTQTRHALKQDPLVQATSSGLDWLQGHRSNVIRTSVAVVVVLAVLIGGALFFQQRESGANAALGQALATYSAQLREPGLPADPSQTLYATAADRSRAANQQFAAAADRYSWLGAGKKARYFAGLTYIDLGQTSQAESSLKQVAGNSDLGSLARLALANLYHQTGRDSEAIEIYQGLIAKPTDVVPAATAKLQLASLYEKTNPEAARKIYAELKDKDKTTAAGEIASQRLASIK